jgi:hypothetical protein
MEQILVAMKRRDRIQEIVPILKKMAKPGMKVTFLFSYPVDAWAWLGHHWVVTESTRGAVSEGKKLAVKYSWEDLRRAVRDYMLNGDFQLIVMSAVNGNTTIEVARLLLVLLRRLRRPSFTSILLHHPRRGADSTCRQHVQRYGTQAQTE